MSNRITSIIICFVYCLCIIAQNDRDHVRRGNRLMRDTLFAKAQVEYQKAIEADNTNAIAHYNLANALMLQNKAEDAMKEYETASKFERNKIRLSKIYHNMGVLLQSAKRYDLALGCYQNSLRNNPSCDETRYNYALCLYLAKKNPSQQNDQNQQQDQNNKDDKKEQDKQNKEKEKQNKEDKQQQEEQKPDMSKENAEQMLKAAMQDEKSTQEKMQRALQQPQRKRLQKQW